MAVTCRNLWQNWLFAEPDNPNVIECKNRLSQYSRQDWVDMAAEAKAITEMLSDLVEYNVPYDSHLATLVFNEIKIHFDKWFFVIDEEYLLRYANLAKYDYEYRTFFEQFHVGLGDYLSNMIKHNLGYPIFQ